MLNPAEDIVNVWLQEVCQHFIMNNIVLRKVTRVIGNKKRGGGRGKEVDFLSTDGKNYFWIEVSVSPSPFLPAKKIHMKKIIDRSLEKFSHEKELALRKRFKKKAYVKWYIYSHKMFLKNSGEEQRFSDALKKFRIKAVSFELILEQVFEKLNYMGYDTPRQNLFLLKKFGYAHVM